MFRYVHHVKHLIKQLNENPTSNAVHKLQTYLNSSDVAFQQLIHHMSDESNFQFFQGSRQEFDATLNNLKQEHEIISKINQRLQLVQNLDQFRIWERLFLQTEPKLHNLSKSAGNAVHQVVEGAKLKMEALRHHLKNIESVEKEISSDEKRLEKAFSQRLLKKELNNAPQPKLQSSRMKRD